MTEKQNKNPEYQYAAEWMHMRFLRMSQVTKKVGLSRSYIYRLIKTGDFPQAIQLGKSAIAFIESDVEEWMHKRIKKGELQKWQQ